MKGKKGLLAGTLPSDSLSGHADHSELLDWFSRTTGSRSRVWLVHGEPDRSAALAAAMREKFPETVTEVAVKDSTVAW